MLSSLYGLGMQLRNTAYDRGWLRSHSCAVPVISVGNLTAGGTGKTPVVEALLRAMLPDWRVAMVTRGYRRKSSGLLVVSDGAGKRSGVEESGDEAAQVAAKFPSAVVIADEQRVRGARYAADNFGVQRIVLDDAYQHRALARDCNILVLDARYPLASLRLLPAGRLREPLRGIDRADIVLLSRCEDAMQVEALRQEVSRRTSVPVFATRFTPVALYPVVPGRTDAASHPVDALAGKRVLAFCGIASPASFTQTLEGMGMEVADTMQFPDHHWYNSDDMQKLHNRAEALGTELLVTTEKDAVRLQKHAGALSMFEVRYPQLELEFIDGDDAKFFEEVERLLAQH
ncbi:tetraacyldisaccharide 4'-kinase [bacterium]|nr:tetraacyldisaccharide 4'-kinase [bacterium]